MRSLMNEKQIRRVLVVAYVFPPAGGAGVQRVTKFVKYLPEFGWDCSVLTVANPSVPVFDETLAEDIPESTVVRLANTLEPGYALKNAVSAGNDAAESTGPSRSIRSLLKSAIRSAGNAVLQPDAQILWYPGAVREGLQLLNELQHDAIFVTAPPFSSLVTGAALSRRSGLPLLVDYRDEWGISNRFQENRQKSTLSHRIQDRMQRRVLRQASAAIATTGRSAVSIEKSVQQAGGTAAVSCIYNGYDASDLESTVSSDDSGVDSDVLTGRMTDTSGHETGGQPADAARKLTIAYVGTLWNLTSIEPLVAAIEGLAATDPQQVRRIELIVAGRRTGAQDAILDRLESTACQLIREGYVEHRRAIEIMRQADVQCLLLSDAPEAARVVPAKTFEYLALGRPILSIGPEGEVQEILSEFPQAESFRPGDTTGISSYLSRQLETSGSGTGDAMCPSAARFERRTLTGLLADVLNRACGSLSTERALADETEPCDTVEVTV